MDPQDNVATVRRMWDAFGQEGLRGILDFAAPDAEWRPYSAHGRVFHDTDSYRAYIEEMEARREMVDARLVELHAAGDCVVASGRLRLRGPEGLTDNPMHWVHRFRDGLIVWTASYPNLDTALEAAGLGAEHRVKAT